MRKSKMSVPTAIRYFSEWTNFTSQLQSDKLIVNKVICGCGMTHYFLSNADPTVLISPRRSLIDSKINDPLLPELFYFDRSVGEVAETMKKLEIYLHNPFHNPGFVPKVLVTYDSLPTLIDIVLKHPLSDKFVFIVDEFTCIFTDARLKGLTEYRLLSSLLQLPNKCIFISATPMHDVYLEEMPEFQQMDYIELEWNESKKMTVEIERKPMKSSVSAIQDEIDKYKRRKYFGTAIVDGNLVYSKEAVFFVNSVRVIAEILKANKGFLTPENTRIICADDKDNLKKIPNEFVPSNFPGRSTYKKGNKTFTFVTSKAFEGADLYSDTASIFIFADPNIKTMNVDLHIDLPQIIGRCRTPHNPFRSKVYYYFKTTGKNVMSEAEANQIIQDRYDKTEETLKNNPNLSDPNLLGLIASGQKSEKYSKTYLDVVQEPDGTPKIDFNRLIWLADMRAVNIKYHQYKDKDSLSIYLEDNGYKLAPVSDLNGPYEEFFINLFTHTKFEEQLEYCFHGLMYDSGLYIYIMNHPAISDDIKETIDRFNYEECRSVSFKLVDIKRLELFKEMKSEIINRLSSLIIREKTYPKRDLKVLIQGVYDSLNITSRKAAASDILDYFSDVKEVKYMDGNNKQQKGFKIIQ